MKHFVSKSRLVMAVAMVMLVLPLFAERQAFDRYQSVVDRQMFGQPPPGFDPTKPPSEVSAKDERAKEQELTKEQEQLKSAIHFSMINKTPSGETAVGFTDNIDNKNPKHYYLKVGESRDGWTVKDADALKAEMTLVKGDIEVTLQIGGNSANGGTKKVVGASATATRPMPNVGNRAMPSVGTRANLLGGNRLGSMRERRMIREQRKAEAEKMAAEEKAQAAAREAQREAERAAEKAQREAEREEQRAQLLQIKEELEKAREERAKAEQEKAEAEENKEGEREGEGE